MNDELKKESPLPNDLFGSKELLKLIVNKLSSQALLISLAISVIIAGVGIINKADELIIIGAIIFISGVGIVGYLFVELKQKIGKGDEDTIGKLNAGKIKSIDNSSGDFSVKVWTTPATAIAADSRDINILPLNKRTEYRIGEKINVHFRANKDCYLTLLNIGTSGKLSILFPNTMHRDNFIRANEVYEIPGKEYGFEYILQGPTGVEKLKAIATLEKVDLLDSQFAPDGSLFRTVAPMAAARDISIIKKKVETISMQNWAEAEWEFSVG